MICYKDKTFCASDCVKEDCYRYLSYEEDHRAKRCGLNIAISDCSHECKDYVGGRGNDGKKTETER